MLRRTGHYIFLVALLVCLKGTLGHSKILQLGQISYEDHAGKFSTKEVEAVDAGIKKVDKLFRGFAIPQKFSVVIARGKQHVGQGIYDGKGKINGFIVGFKDEKLTSNPHPAVSHEYCHVIMNEPANWQRIGSPDKLKAKLPIHIFEEFFCDLTAVLATGDPEIMAKIWSDDYDAHRSFINPMAGSDQAPRTLPHHYFGQTRRLLWQRYINDGMTVESANKILSETLAAIATELARHAKNTAMSPTNTGLPSKEATKIFESSLLNEVRRRLEGQTQNGKVSGATP